MKIPCLIILWLLSVSSCLAAGNTEQEVNDFGNYATLQQIKTEKSAESATSVSASDKLAHEFQVLKEKNKVEEIIALCVLAVVSLFIVLYFLTRNADGNTGIYIVNATGLIFIVVGTISLVIMAQTEQQLTAAVGILGAIAGYLFSSIKNKVAASNTTEDTSAPQK